jgi:hypothetical protein
MTPALQKRWAQIETVYREAERCGRYHKDENAWTEVVRLVLKAAIGDAPMDMLEVNNVSGPPHLFRPRYPSKHR